MTTAAAAPELEIAPVSAPGGGLGHELRAIKVVWKRDLIRFRNERARILSSLMQPLLFLFVLGKGLAAVVPAEEGTDYSTFLFPGVLITGVMFTAVFSAISIVWDREFGFLREMLVAPVRRSSIVIGKCLGSASIATLQGIAILSLAGLVHIPYHPLLLLGGTVLTFLVAFTITAFGLVLAVRVQSVQTVMPVMQLLLTPLMFLSGSLFPIGGNIPAWLSIATKVNPLSYGVDATRSLFFHFLPEGATGGALVGGITWFGWLVPPWMDILIVLGTGMALLSVACILFSKTE
ncbi:MAG TPA: ABC transporter permease [Actinomycetota bacterium]|nr:ABC transporter permease [Actinomycetota bacterium]